MSPKKTTKDSKFGTGGNFKSKEFIEDSSSEDEGGAKNTVNTVCQTNLSMVTNDMASDLEVIKLE